MESLCRQQLKDFLQYKIRKQLLEVSFDGAKQAKTVNAPSWKMKL
jgi:hypothetical protein